MKKTTYEGPIGSNDYDYILRELREIKSMLRRVLPPVKKETWVGVSTIQELTGWNGKEKMRWARNKNLVTFKNGRYLLESIHPMFLANRKTSER